MATGCFRIRKYMMMSGLYIPCIIVGLSKSFASSHSIGSCIIILLVFWFFLAACSWTVLSIKLHSVQYTAHHMIDLSTSSPVCPLVSTHHHTLVTSVMSAHHDHTVYTYIIMYRWVCPSQKEGDRRVASLSSIRSSALRNSYEYRCASNPELSLLQRRGGARKPINTLSQRLVLNVLGRAVLQSDWCCMIFCSRTNAW